MRGMKYNSILFTLLCLCSFVWYSTTMQADQCCSVFVQFGDTVSIYCVPDDNNKSIYYFLADVNGKPQSVRKNAAGEVELSENALWKVYKAGDVQFTRYGTQPPNNEYGKFGEEYRAYFQNIATKRWMRMNDKHQLTLVDDEHQASAFAHIHSYTTYDYAKYHVALARLSVVRSATEYYSIGCNKSGNGWETMPLGGGQVVRLSKWSSLREKKKVAAVDVVLDELQSTVTQDKRKFHYFPATWWQNDDMPDQSDLGKITSAGMDMAEHYVTGYEDQKAVYNLLPRVEIYSYYESLVTPDPKQKDKTYDYYAQGKRIIRERDTIRMPEAGDMVTMDIHWGVRTNPEAPSYSLLNPFKSDGTLYGATEKGCMVYPDTQNDLDKSGFDASVSQRYMETAKRNMMHYTLDWTNLTLTITPDSVSPWNIYTWTENNRNEWFYYLDTLTLTAGGKDCESTTMQIPIGRESLHAVHTATAEVDITVTKEPDTYRFDEGTTVFQAKGGTWSLNINSLMAYKGIGLFTMDMNAGDDRVIPLVLNINHNVSKEFVENRTIFTGGLTNSNVTVSSGADWVTVSPAADPRTTTRNVTVSSLAVKEPERHTEVSVDIACPRVDEDGRKVYISAKHTVEQMYSQGVIFRTQTGRFYSTRDENNRQRVHTYEQTIYYEKGQPFVLRLREPDYFGYMRWYDYQTGKDPKFQPDGNGKYVELTDFWNIGPYVKHRKNNQWSGNCWFSPLNSSAEQSKGLFYLFPEGAGTDLETTNYNPTIVIKQDLDIDIACDVSNYTDYSATYDGEGNLLSLTEPTLSYRQIFHLHPGDKHESDEIIKKTADDLALCTKQSGRYFEEHEYEAPVGKMVDLEKKYLLAHANGANSNQHYWVKMDAGVNGMEDGVVIEGNTYAHTWKNRYEAKCYLVENGQYTPLKGYSYDPSDTSKPVDYLRLTSDKEKEMEIVYWIEPEKGNSSGSFGNYYTGDTLLLAHYKVRWVNKDTTVYGPSAKPLITLGDIEERYVLLSKLDFDYDVPGTTATKLFNIPLNPEESGCGFVPYKDVMRDKNNPDKYYIQRKDLGRHWSFPNYGEYCIINKVGTDAENGGGQGRWLRPASQHTGSASDGYCLYVDGAANPSKFLSLTTDAQLCSGQKMYCAMWLCNPSIDSTPSEFEIYIDGRNRQKDGWSDWEEVSSHYIGELKNKGYWQQICFPVNTLKSYDESRIRFFNFAGGNGGNNFLLDDVWLYASRIPLEAFQINTTCLVNDAPDTENSNFSLNGGIAETDNIATIIRVDYENLENLGTEDANTDKYLFYQIYEYCEKDSALRLSYHNDNCLSDADCRLYNDTCGVVRLPEKGWIPAKKDGLHSTLNDFLAYIKGQEETAKDDHTYIGYVPVTETGVTRYVLYIVQMLKSDELNPRHIYEVRTSYSSAELPDALCSMRTKLPVYDPTSFEFNGETYPEMGQCANNNYPLEIIVRQELTDGNDVHTLQANARGEWLKGFTFDSIYFNAYNNGLTNPTDQAAIKRADDAFIKQYGYPRADVEAAIATLRRDPNTYEHTYYDELDYRNLKPGVDYWGDNPEGKEDNYYYNIVWNLCNKGLLRLGLDRDDIYLMGNDTACYWLYPTAGTAHVNYKGQDYTLNQCASPKFIMVFSVSSAHDYNFSLGRPLNESDNGKMVRIRITQHEANHGFRVPCYLGEGIVLAWDSTQININGTNDPDILRKMNQKGFSMHYTQDKIYTELHAQGKESNYYKASGDTIVFTPVDAEHVEQMKELKETGKYGDIDGHPGYWVVNSDTMRMGYEYTLRTQMKTRPTDGDNDGPLLIDPDNPSCLIGYAYFTLLVVPDTLVWTPTLPDNNGNYHWGEDKNWSGLSMGIVCENLNYAPLKSTVVIIPEGLPQNMYPYIDKEENLNSGDVNYYPNVCKKVQFRNDVRVIGQQHLQYEAAYVDMSVRPQTADYGGWNALAAPLQGMYAGDLFLPHYGMYDSADAESLEKTKEKDDYSQDFRVAPFAGTRSGDAAYAFWIRFYDKAVYNYTQGNYYEDATGTGLIESGSADFYTTNRLNQPLAPGEGFALYAMGLGETSLEVRLPKTDTEYHYYDEKGTLLPGKESVPRTDSHKLAYTLDEYGKMTITLQNKTTGKYFLLGNPTLAYLNLHKLAEVNNGKLTGAYRILSDGTWASGTLELMNQWTNPSTFIAPMQSVLLEAKSEQNELQLDITPECLVLSNTEGYIGDESVMYLRRAGVRSAEPQIMQIRAMAGGAMGMTTLALKDDANNGYRTNEDVTFVATGVESNASGVLTPVNIYTLADNRTLAVDIRRQADAVPLGFVIDDQYRADSIVLQFGFNMAWSEECYLCDTLTGKRQRVRNDLCVRIPMPQNHEIRYYIMGINHSTPENPDNPATDNETIVVDNGGHVVVCSLRVGNIEVVADGFIADVCLYDITGHRVGIATANANTTTMSLDSPSGIVLADVRLRSGVVYRTKVLVK